MARQRSFGDDCAYAEKEVFEIEALLGPQEMQTCRPGLLLRAKTALLDSFQRVLPSSQQRQFTDGRPPSTAPRLRRTAYLDGLRGFAALLVYCLHHQKWGHPDHNGDVLEDSFGMNGEYYFACLPGVRLFFSGGHFAVAIFYIISGYVLSHKALNLLHSRELEQLSNTLGSALFRRWLRLYLPVFATTFIWMTSWHVLGIRSSNHLHDLPDKSYLHEIWKWYANSKNYSFVFNDDTWNSYNDHTWSIPLEFRGSIVVYTTLLALARCNTNKRLLCEIGLIWYFLYVVDGWYCALFAMGILLCDLDLLAEKGRGRGPAIFRNGHSVSPVVCYTLLAIGLYLGGVPSGKTEFQHFRSSPGWYLLSFLKPQAVFDYGWFYRFWGGTFLIIAIPRIPWLRSFFEGPLCQYLGRISYALYLVHGPVLWTMGDRVYAATGRIRETHIKIIPRWINLFPFSGWGPLGLEVNFLLAHLILLPVTLLLAEATTKFIDNPSVKLSQWLFNYSTDHEPNRKRDQVEKRSAL